MRKSRLSSDLVFLILLAFTIPLVWILIGWRPGEVIGGNDTALEYLSYKELYEVGGAWWRRLYNPWVFGGTSGHGAFGSPLPYSLFAAMRINPDYALPLTNFSLQILFSYLIVKSGLLLSFVLGLTNRSQVPPVSLQLILGITLAFAPVISWRIYFGHQIFLFSLLVLPAWLSLILMLKTRAFSWTTYFAAGFAWVTCLTTVGQQLTVYSFFFLILFWCWLVFSKPKLSLAAVGLFGLFAISGILVALGPLAESISFFLKDASRNLSSEPVVFSFLPTNLWDWAEGLAWFYFDSSNLGKVHETNNALGPIALLAFGTLFLRPKLLALVSISVLIAVCFTLKDSFISNLLLSYVPILGRFRVPIRVELVLGLLIYTLAVSTMALLYSRMRDERTSWLNSLSLLLPFLVLFHFLDPFWREILIWSVAGGMSLMAIAPSLGSAKSFTKFFSNRIWIGAAAVSLLLVPLMSVWAFHQRELVADQRYKLSEFIVGQKTLLTEQSDFPNSNLERVHFSEVLSSFHANTPMALEVGSIFGYWPPTSRFLRLFDRFDPNQLSPTTVQLMPSEELLVSSPLASLYNINHFLRLGVIHKNSVEKVSKPWWWPARVDVVDRFEDIEFANNNTAAREQVYFLKSDLSEGIILSEQCGSSVISYVSDVQRGPTLLTFQYSSPESCLLVFPMNFLSNMSATLGEHEVKVLPANGTLVSLLLPPGQKTVELKMNPPIDPSTSLLLALVGLMGLGTAGVFCSKFSQDSI